MGFFTGSVFSETLNMDTTIGVILPHDCRFHRGMESMTDGRTPRRRPRTLILLHGLTDNWSAWGYRTRIMSYAEAHDVAVVMPEVQRSFYQDMVYGESYFTYVSEELPKLAAEMFNVSAEPEDLMVAGLSMGGYGALRCGLAAPGRYRAIGAFSSAISLDGFLLDIPERKETKGMDRLVRGMFGEHPALPEDSRIQSLAERAAKAGMATPIFMTCGAEDPLYPDSEAFFDQARTLGLNVTFESWPGVHEWGFWDRSIALFLERFA